MEAWIGSAGSAAIQTRPRSLDRRQSWRTTFRFRILKAKIECDQALLVRKERRCDVLQEIRKRHLAGAKPVRSGQPGRSVASLATGMQGRGQKRDGNGPGDA
jgi:hypothetical protein